MTRWHTCRSRWLKRQQTLRDLSLGFDQVYKQSPGSQLVAGLGPGPLALTVNLALSMVADLPPVQSLAPLNLGESQLLSAWRVARQVPRPGVRARLLKRLREHIDSRGWPVPGRRIVSVPPEISLDVAKRFFMGHLLVLKQINFSRWRWLSESTIFSHSSRRTCADECWTLSDTEEPGDTSLRGAHKDSRHWKFECRREPHEASQFLRRSLGLIAVLGMTHLLFPPLCHKPLLLVITGHSHALQPSNDVCRSLIKAKALLLTMKHDPVYGPSARCTSLRLYGNN